MMWKELEDTTTKDILLREKQTNVFHNDLILGNVWRLYYTCVCFPRCSKLHIQWSQGTEPDCTLPAGYGKGHFCHIIYIAPVPLTNGVHKHSFMKNINFILVLMTTISKCEKHPSIFSMSVGLTNHHNLSKSL